MLSVVSTEASSPTPAICIASLAMTRGALRRSFDDFVMNPTLPAAPRPPRSPTPALTTPARLFLRAIRPLGPSRRARPEMELDFPSFQIRAGQHHVHGIPQPEPVPRALRAERESVFRECERRIPDGPLRQEALDRPTLEEDEQPARREPHDRSMRLLAQPLQGVAHRLHLHDRA